jgi:hypothetical protein
MPPEIGSTAPATIMQGDTLRWRFTSRDATPATATLVVRVSSPTQTVEVPGTPDADGWLVTVSAEQMKRLGAGLLRYLVRATYAGGIVQTLASGTITAVGVTDLGTGASTASHAARMVAKSRRCWSRSTTCRNTASGSAPRSGTAPKCWKSRCATGSVSWRKSRTAGGCRRS